MLYNTICLLNDQQALGNVRADDVTFGCRRWLKYIADDGSRCSSRELQLKASKTELFWFGMLLTVLNFYSGDGAGNWQKHHSKVYRNNCVMYEHTNARVNRTAMDRCIHRRNLLMEMGTIL
jgi:hypothetical protein